MGFWSRIASRVPLRLLGSGTPSEGKVLRAVDATRAEWSDPLTAAREPSGVEDRTASTISTNDGTRTFTITPVSGSWRYFASGVAFVVSEAKSVTWTDVDGLHFIYFEDGTLTHSTTAWDLSDPDVVPICALLWDATNNVSIALEERHGLVMDRATHQYLHSTRGTQLVSGGAITAGTYSLAPAAPTNADNNFGVDATVITDEDIRSSLSALTDGSAIGRLWRDGASGVWRWDSSATFPKVGGSGSYIAKNVFSGGTWQLVDLAANNYVSWWLVAIPALTTGYRFALIVGQAEHATLAAAQAESITGLSFGSMPFTEAVGLARIIYRTGAGYTSTGKCRIEDVTRLVVAGLTL